MSDKEALYKTILAQQGLFNSGDSAELREVLGNTSVQRALGALCSGISGLQAQLGVINLGSTQGIADAAKLQGKIEAGAMFVDFLLDLAFNFEDQPQSSETRDAA